MTTITLYDDGSHSESSGGGGGPDGSQNGQGFVKKYGEIILEHASDYVKTGSFDCSKAAIDVVCANIKRCDIGLFILNTAFDADECDVKKEVNFVIKTKTSKDINEQIEEIPVCSNKCELSEDDTTTTESSANYLPIDQFFIAGTVIMSTVITAYYMDI